MMSRIQLSFALILLFAGASVTWGQQSTPRMFYVVEEETIDAGLTESYERGLSLFIEAMRKAKLGPEFNWGASQHGQTYFYLFAVKSLADLEPGSTLKQQRQQQLFQAIGPEVARQFEALTSPAIRSNRLSVFERAEEFCYKPTQSIVKNPPFAFVETHWIRPGKEDQYKGVMRRIVETIRKVGHPIGWTAYRTVVGEGKAFYGESRLYTYVSPYDSKSQFYEQHWFSDTLGKALGEERTKQLVSELLQCLMRVEGEDYLLRPDLGYQANLK